MNWETTRDIITMLTSGACVTLVKFLINLNTKVSVLENSTREKGVATDIVLAQHVVGINSTTAGFNEHGQRLAVLESVTSDLKGIAITLSKLQEVSTKLDTLIVTQDKRLQVVENAIMAVMQGQK